MLEGAEQQFKYTQPAVCRNPVCNNMNRFTLDVKVIVLITDLT